jgi:serine/threonine protein kinase
MAFTAGTRIGSYEITSPIGEGGMGVVYRAHDTKLGRDVAIKALPDAFANNSGRLQRFQREAQFPRPVDSRRVGATMARNSFSFRRTDK